MTDLEEFMALVGTNTQKPHKYLKYFEEQKDNSIWMYILTIHRKKRSGDKVVGTVEIRTFNPKEIDSVLEGLIFERFVSGQLPTFTHGDKK